MTSGVDFFHPYYAGWKDYQEGVPEAIQTALTGLDFGEGLTIRTQTLPFYPEAEFLIFRHPGWVPANLFVYALKKDDEIVWLNGTSPGIHQFNASGHLVLTDENALDYIRFFCFFVRGEEGPFYVAHTPDAPYLTSEIGAAGKGKSELRALFEQRYQSPRTFGTTSAGERRYSMLIMYSNALFITDFALQPSGMVEMKDDIPIMADLPSKIDAPLVPPKHSTNSLH